MANIAIISKTPDSHLPETIPTTIFQWQNCSINANPVSVNNHRRSGSRYHQHTVVASQNLIVDIYADNGVRSHTAGTLRHLVHSLLTCLYKLVLIRSGASAYEVADAGGKVLQKVDSGDDLSEDDSLVFPDCGLQWPV